VQYSAVIRQKDQYEVKWFIPLVELSLEDRLESPGTMTVFTPQCESKKYPSQKKTFAVFSHSWNFTHHGVKHNDFCCFKGV